MASSNPNILKLWYGQTTAEQNAALLRFKEEAEGELGEALFYSLKRFCRLTSRKI